MTMTKQKWLAALQTKRVLVVIAGVVGLVIVEIFWHVFVDFILPPGGYLRERAVSMVLYIAVAAFSGFLGYVVRDEISEATRPGNEADRVAELDRLTQDNLCLNEQCEDLMAKYKRVSDDNNDLVAQKKQLEELIENDIEPQRAVLGILAGGSCDPNDIVKRLLTKGYKEGRLWAAIGKLREDHKITQDRSKPAPHLKVVEPTDTVPRGAV